MSYFHVQKWLGNTLQLANYETIDLIVSSWVFKIMKRRVHPSQWEKQEKKNTHRKFNLITNKLNCNISIRKWKTYCNFAQKRFTFNSVIKLKNKILKILRLALHWNSQLLMCSWLKMKEQFQHHHRNSVWMKHFMC